MQVKLNLILSVIKEAVKAETFIKGTIDRAAGNDQHASNGVAFHETAGDEDVHERKILRGIYVASDKLRSFILDYLNETSATYGDNNVVVINESTDTIDIKLELTSRFRKPNSNSLARLCSRYIEDQTLVWWWGTVGNQPQIQFYQTQVQEDILAIQKMFVKSAPSSAVIPYTSSISLVSSTNTAISSIGIDVDEEVTVSYIIDDDVIDDIEIVTDSPKVKVKRSDDGLLYIKGLHPGTCNVTLYSIHDETVYASLSVVVSGDDTNGIYHEDHRPPFPYMYPRY